MDRRTFVKSSAGALLIASAQAQTTLELRDLPSLWDVDRSIANLENAYWGVMPREIEDEYREQTQFLNRRNVVFVRDAIAGHERTVAMDSVRAELATLMGAPKEEFALTRNGTEALQNLIKQYARLKPGDAVMYESRGIPPRPIRRPAVDATHCHCCENGLACEVAVEDYR